MALTWTIHKIICEGAETRAGGGVQKEPHPPLFASLREELIHHKSYFWSEGFQNLSFSSK